MSTLSRLTYFRLRLWCPMLFRVPSFHSQRDVVLDWRHHCPSLNKIVFESSNETKVPEWTFDEEAMDWVCSVDE